MPPQLAGVGGRPQRECREGGAGGKGTGRREGSGQGWAGALQGWMTSAQVRQMWPLENRVRKGVGELHDGGLRGERELRQAKQSDHGR